MQSALSVVFYVTHRGVMEHLARLNQCNFKNVMVRSIIHVWAEVSTAASCLLIMNEWPDKLTESGPESPPPGSEIRPQWLWQGLCTTQQSASLPLPLWSDKWKLWLGRRRNHARHAWLIKWWPSIVTITCISYCTNNKVYGCLKSNLVNLLGI